MASTDPAPSDASCAALLPLGSHATTAPIALRRPVFVIGSRKDIVRLHLQSSTVSKAHCVVVVNAWGCYVHDLGSRTGTMVNGKPIVDHDLSDGDVLQIGRFQFRYQAPRHARPEPAGLPPADVNVSTLTEPLRLHKRVITLGRRVGSDVQFDDSRVSNIHALIVEQDGRRLVRDLSSRTGTWLDEKPVHQEPLPDGAPLRIGGATITLTEPLAPAARAPGAPLTLADAPSASAAAAAGPGVMNLGLITPDLDDANPDDADAVTSPDDTVPAAEDDADDLAALRRGWKAPPRDESAPAAAPIAEAPAPSAEADIDDSDLIPLELEPEPRSAVPPARTPAPPPVAPTPPAEVAARELAPLELEPLALEPLAEAPAEADDAIDLDAIEPPAAAVAVPDRVEDDLDLDLLDEAAPAEADEVVVAPSAEQPVTPEMPADADLAEAEADVDADDLADIEVAEADRPEVIAVPATPRTADVETIDSDAEDAPAEAVAEAVTDTADESDALAPAAVAEPDALVLDEVRPDPDAPAAETDTATEAEAESADALVLDEAAPATGEETPVVVDVLDLPPADAPVIETRAPAATTADAVTTAEPAAEIVAAETPSEETPAAIVAEAPADDVTAVDTLDLEPLDLSEITLAPDPEAPAAATAVAADVAEAATPVAEAAPGLDLLDEADAAADADAADHADVDLDVVSIESVPVPAEVDLVDLAADDRDDAVEDAIDGETIAPEAAAAETMVTPPAPSALAADAATDALADARDPFTAVPEIEPDTEPAGVAAETSVLEPPDLDALDLDTLDLDTLDLDAVDLNVLDEAVAGEAVVEPAPQAARTDAPADTRTAATGVIVGEEIEPVADANLEPALPVAAAEAFVAPAEPIIEPDLVRLSEDSDDDANEATALAVDLGLVLDDDLVHDGPNDVPETTGPVPAAGPVDIDLSSATPVARTPDLAEAAGPASIDLSRLGAIDGPAFQPHALPDHAVAAGDTLTEAFADDGLELIEADRDTATPVAEAPAFGANDTTELAKPDAATADTIDPLDDPFADPFGNRISAPEGGSLADLMPGGPPLLGGSFMHLPPAPPPPEAAGPGERRRPLRVGFSDGRPGPRPTPRRGAPFAAERTIADALGKSAPDDTSELIGHAPSIDACSGATSVPAPPAVPPRPAAAPTP
ncbi:MAG TPA: FHA domain-containing protein, partial [Tepidisphaeraceae bacterium]